MNFKRRLQAALCSVALAASPALADRVAPPPQRSANVVVYGNDPCPAAEGDEIVVCARKPEGERYRIPKQFRDQSGNRPPESSWGARVADLDAISADTRPNGCSVVGSYGQSGCFSQMLRQWSADRRSMHSAP